MASRIVSSYCTGLSCSQVTVTSFVKRQLASASEEHIFSRKRTEMADFDQRTPVVGGSHPIPHLPAPQSMLSEPPSIFSTLRRHWWKAKSIADRRHHCAADMCATACGLRRWKYRTDKWRIATVTLAIVLGRIACMRCTDAAVARRADVAWSVCQTVGYSREFHRNSWTSRGGM